MRNGLVSLIPLALAYKRASPRRTDGGDPSIPAAFSTWSLGMYMCATTARARIAEITFTYNGTGGLESLQLEKNYLNSTEPGRPVETPLWGVEKVEANISNANPLWGLIDDIHQNSSLLQTLRNDILYLPASSSLLSGPAYDTIASATIPGAVLYLLYFSFAPFGLTLDYSGQSDQAILNKWITLGGNLDGLAEMVNLVFVDMMTQLVVGSNSVLPAPLSIEVLENRVQYNLLYAILV